ncbi:unnamed protein product [Ectocarpus sp. 12 AP-2014]
MLVATALAQEAGQAMLDAKALCAQEGKGKDGGGVSYKGRHDLVTETDRSNEALIQRGLHEKFPEDHFLGEEASADRGGAPSELSNNILTWVVDPIDGTTNFVHGFPVTCVSIGLAKGDEVVVGVVFNPFTQELYQAIKGGGSFLNGKRLEVSETTVMEQAMVMAEYSSLREEESLRKMLDTTGAIASAARAVRQTGCGAMDLCFLARGSVDAVFGGVAGVWKPWDWAAGVLIATEAGAAISAGDGGDFRLMGDTMLGAATAELASSLREVLKDI